MKDEIMTKMDEFWHKGQKHPFLGECGKVLTILETHIKDFCTKFEVKYVLQQNCKIKLIKIPKLSIWKSSQLNESSR